jgi:hypothetical protein
VKVLLDTDAYSALRRGQELVVEQVRKIGSGAPVDGRCRRVLREKAATVGAAATPEEWELLRRRGLFTKPGYKPNCSGNRR